MQVVCALKELAKGGHTEFYFYFFIVSKGSINAGGVRAEGARKRRAHRILFFYFFIVLKGSINAGGVRAEGARERRAHSNRCHAPGAQFACFTGTKGTPFACFTSTKVQIQTPEELRESPHLRRCLQHVSRPTP
jgi:hypothetical protein